MKVELYVNWDKKRITTSLDAQIDLAVEETPESEWDEYFEEFLNSNYNIVEVFDMLSQEKIEVRNKFLAEMREEEAHNFWNRDDGEVVEIEIGS